MISNSSQLNESYSICLVSLLGSWELTRCVCSLGRVSFPLVNLSTVCISPKRRPGHPCQSPSRWNHRVLSWCTMEGGDERTRGCFAFLPFRSSPRRAVRCWQICVAFSVWLRPSDSHFDTSQALGMSRGSFVRPHGALWARDVEFSPGVKTPTLPYPLPRFTTSSGL